MKKSDLKWKAKFKVFTKKLKKKIINLKNLERYLNGLVKNLRLWRPLKNKLKQLIKLKQKGLINLKQVVACTNNKKINKK